MLLLYLTLENFGVRHCPVAHLCSRTWL